MDRERDARTGVVEIRFAAGKGHAVIAGDNHEGVLEGAELLEFVEELPQFAIEALHFEVVVRDVAANFRTIGIVFEELDLAEIHPALFA